jgi:hypothetical protein
MKKSEMLKRAAKWSGKKFDTIIDRNGCKLVVPAAGETANEYMNQVFESMELYAIDGLFGKEWNVKLIVNGDPFISCYVENSRNPKETIVVNVLAENYRSMLTAIARNNFSSWENFKKNLLPSFNGPDKACFICLTDPEGIAYGFKFDIPNLTMLHKE